MYVCVRSALASRPAAHSFAAECFHIGYVCYGGGRRNEETGEESGGVRDVSLAIYIYVCVCVCVCVRAPACFLPRRIAALLHCLHKQSKVSESGEPSRHIHSFPLRFAEAEEHLARGSGFAAPIEERLSFYNSIHTYHKLCTEK